MSSSEYGKHDSVVYYSSKKNFLQHGGGSSGDGCVFILQVEEVSSTRMRGSR